jgi:hypothetical protein
MSRSVPATLRTNGGSLPPNGPREEYITHVLALYHEVQALLARLASRGNKLQLLVLFLSVLTSGSLWLLLSKSLPQTALWFGAVASTLTTGITLYLKSSGLNQVRAKCLTVFSDLGQFLAEVRSSDNMSEEYYWKKYKAFESRVAELQYGLHGQDT